MVPPRFAVVGTGRSGTSYVASYLCACGVSCGHERWWTPKPERRQSGLDGDSSWLALPDIETGAWTGPVLHVTRHPVDVVRSLVGIGFFTPRDSPFVRFAMAHEPELAELDPLRASVEWWVRWNRRCAALADLTVRLEDFPQLLADVSEAIRFPFDGAAGTMPPRTINHRQRAEIEAAEIWHLLAGRASDFGYQW